MQNTIVHHEGATSLKAAVRKIKPAGAVIKIGLDIHALIYVAVAQYDQLLPKPARRFAPVEFVPWVESQPDRARRPGRVRLAHGAFPTRLSAGAKTSGHPGKRLSCNGSSA
jgi:hypothetical protein